MKDRPYNQARRKAGGVKCRHRRLTLVEMTIILSVISVLTAVLVPTVMSHITQSRILRARQDVRAISEAIHRFYQDTGFVPKTTDSVDGQMGTNTVDMLVTPGHAPRTPSAAGYDLWADGTVDYLSNHVVNNVPGYALKTSMDTLGWNGPYFASATDADPWGNRYMVNVAFLEPTPGLVINGLVKRAVFVVSAGPNGIIEVPFEQPVTEASLYGDDIVQRIQ